jgi:type I restriction enzyme S subunit
MGARRMNRDATEVREVSAKYQALAEAREEVPAGYKRTEVGVIPEDWDVYELREFKPFITSGSRGWARYYSDGGDLFVRITNLSRENIYIDLAACKYVEIPKNTSEGIRTQLENGDILISITADIGIVGYIDASVPKPSYINQHISLIRFGCKDINTLFLAYYLASYSSQRNFNSFSDQGAKAGLNLDGIGKLKTVFPKLNEQCAIATALSDVDALIAALDKLIAKKRAIKTATMQQLLTGRKRLPGFSGEWEVKSIGKLERDKYIKLYRGDVISKLDIENCPGNYPIYSSSVLNEGLFGNYGEFMFDEELITWSIDGGGHFFYRPKHRFSVTNVCGYMRADTTRVSYKYLMYALQLLHSEKTFDYQTKAHPSVVRKEYEVALPLLPEQTAIAQILSDMDAEIAALEERRAKTRAIKQGMMQELLTGRTRLI